MTMGCYDGAEICELVSLYLLNEIESQIGKADIGLYRDDGLAMFPNLSGPKADRMRKDLIEIFKRNGLNITIDVNLKVVDFLDVTLNLNNKSYYPFRKPNNKPLYINKNSNYPPQILKQLPEMINSKYSNNSCSEEVFNDVKPLYQTGLKNSGYNYEINLKLQ